MKRATRSLLALAAAGLLISATGCRYDYGYYSVGYSYGCAPSYHTSWGLDRWGSQYNYSSCYGTSYGVSYTEVGHGFGHHHHPCD